MLLRDQMTVYNKICAMLCEKVIFKHVQSINNPRDRRLKELRYRSCILKKLAELFKIVFSIPF